MDEEAKKAYYAKVDSPCLTSSFSLYLSVGSLVEVERSNRGEYSAIIRRLLVDGAKKEGFDPDGIL